jgi:hypothetical protein
MPELSGACGAGPGGRDDPSPGAPLDGDVAERHQWASSVQSGACRCAWHQRRPGDEHLPHLRGPGSH